MVLPSRITNRQVAVDLDHAQIANFVGIHTGNVHAKIAVTDGDFEATVIFSLPAQGVVCIGDLGAVIEHNVVIPQSKACWPICTCGSPQTWIGLAGLLVVGDDLTAISDLDGVVFVFE